MPAPQLNTISRFTDQYDMLLAEFPDIMTPNFMQSPTKHGVEHFITTKGLFMPVLVTYPQTS